MRCLLNVSRVTTINRSKKVRRHRPRGIRYRLYAPGFRLYCRSSPPPGFFLPFHSQSVLLLIRRYRVDLAWEDGSPACMSEPCEWSRCPATKLSMQEASLLSITFFVLSRTRHPYGGGSHFTMRFDYYISYYRRAARLLQFRFDTTTFTHLGFDFFFLDLL